MSPLRHHAPGLSHLWDSVRGVSPSFGAFLVKISVTKISPFFLEFLLDKAPFRDYNNILYHNGFL